MWFTHKKFTDGEPFEAKVLRSHYSDINDEWWYTVEYSPCSADDYNLADADTGKVSRDVTEKFLKAREVPWTLFSDHCATVSPGRPTYRRPSLRY